MTNSAPEIGYKVAHKSQADTAAGTSRPGREQSLQSGCANTGAGVRNLKCQLVAIFAGVEHHRPPSSAAAEAFSSRFKAI